MKVYSRSYQLPQFLALYRFSGQVWLNQLSTIKLMWLVLSCRLWELSSNRFPSSDLEDGP